MQETHVTATDFRTHLTDWANAVAARGERIVMSRHRFPMVALVSEDDLKFLRKHKPLAGEEQQGPAVEDLPHPSNIESVEELERIYEQLKGRNDVASLRWRGMAFVVLRARTGKYPQTLPFDTS
jgi:PHD/YefM family antitoxin component YafN of YafNO toxin-antitoxin module